MDRRRRYDMGAVADLRRLARPRGVSLPHRSADQAAYLDRLRRALRRGGHAIIGTFALDGPQMCSGLPVARCDAASLGALLGPDFVLIDARSHEHVTPRGAKQRFQFSTFRFRGEDEGGA